MAGIDSSIGGKSFTASSSQRVFEVPDESGLTDPQDPFGPGYVSANPYAKNPPGTATGPAAPVPQQAHSHYQNQRPAPTASQPLISDFNQLNQARREKREGGRLSTAARERIEFLVNLSRLTKDVTIEGVTFSLRTLSQKETADTMQAVANSPQATAIWEVRKQQLVRSLYAIDGHNIADVIGTDSLEVKAEVLDEMGEHVVAHLYAKFAEMTKEANEKYNPKTDREMKEVVEDVKK